MVPAKLDLSWRIKRQPALWIFVCLCVLVPAPAARAQTDNVNHLILQLKNPNVYTRRSAALSLGNSKDPRAVSPLIAAINDKDVDVKLNAATALGQIGKPAIAPLIDALKNPTLRDRDTVVSALGKIGMDALPAAIVALKDPNPNLRASAAATINFIEVSFWVDSHFRDPSAVEPLIAALSDTDWKVRQNAAEALGEMKDARALNPLIALVSDPDARVRAEAAYVLGKFGDTTAIGPLAAALNDPSPEVKLNATSALAALGDTRAIQPLSTDLHSSDSRIRMIAIDGLAKIGAPATSVLIEALGSSDDSVEHTAMYALEKINDPRASAALTARQNHIYDVAQNYTTVIAAGKPASINALIDALKEHGDPTMAEAFLNSGNKQLRDAAKDWAKSNGYQTMSFPVPSLPLKWGSGH